MINLGSWKDTTWPDGWTSVTVDGQRSAQFEHTILVTETGVEVLTARLDTSPPLWWEVGQNSSKASENGVKSEQ
jgi:methionyl aminopeptidase